MPAACRAGDTAGVPWYDEAVAELERAFRDREFPADSVWLSEASVFDMSRSLGDNRGVHEGVASIETVFHRFMEAWETVDWRVTEVEELGGRRLLVKTHVTTRGRASEIEIDAHGASLWEFDDDRRLTRWTLFQSYADAARELGLDP